jgi:SIR2-like domain
MPFELPAFVVNGGGTVIVSCGDSSPDQCWMKLDRVAGEFDGAPVVFVWRDRGKWTAFKVSGKQRLSPSQTDLEMAASFLASEQILTPGNHVVFRCQEQDASTPAGDIKVQVPPPRGRSSPLSRPGGAREQVLTDQGIEAWLDQENAETIKKIVLSLRSPTGVIPFVGAGTSVIFSYPLWGRFFEDFANDAARAGVSPLSQETRDAVIEHVKLQEFEEAAGLLVEWNAEVFYQRLEKDFGGEPKLAGKTTPLTWLPLIAPGPIITTNVDSVIETVFKDMGKPFPNALRILGAREHPIDVVTALQQNLSALVKIHGDATTHGSLVFTDIEYQDSYGTIDDPGPLEQLATVIYTNRPLLFLGCSLETDRTLTSLQTVHERNPYVGHYAISATYFRSARRDQRATKLRNAAGIRPLWYRPGEHGDIDCLLAGIVSQTAVDEITQSTTQPSTMPARPATTAPPTASTGTAMPPPTVFAGSPSVTVAPSNEQPDRSSDLTKEHIEAVAKELVGGRLAFFLGSAVHTNKMDADAFYYEICREGGIEWPARDRADAAQFVADVNRATLSATVSRLIHAHYTQPCQAHRFVATLPAALKRLGHNTDILIMTTNYDTMIEDAFAGAHEPYHLFVYNHDGLYAGRFLHRRPDDREFAIRTPAAIRAPLDAPAIVKLNGGIDPVGRLPTSFVVASSDFEELSTRLPDVLPQVVWDALKTRSLLFLGHGLREPDVRSLIRRRNREHAPNSWAVQRHPTDRRFWKAQGIELIDADLHVYLTRLESALNTAPPTLP